MVNRRNSIFVTLSLLIAYVFVSVLSAQETVRPSKPNGALSLKWQAETDDRLSSIQAAIGSIRSDMAKSANTDAHLSVIEKNTNDLKESGWVKTVIPAAISAISLLVGLWIGNYFTGKLQKERMAHEATLAREDAKSEIGSAVIEWELKQLAALYGPMRALLGQSMGLYRLMNKALTESHKDTFRFVPNPSSPDGVMLEIQTSPGTWERFRTVLHISRVYGQGFGIDTYFDEIVSIGHRMVKTIQKQAGYARSEESELMTIFARYLAHFAVLKHVHERARKSRDEAIPGDKTGGGGAKGSGMAIDLSAAFPEEVHRLINQGFEALTSSVREWRQKAVS